MADRIDAETRREPQHGTVRAAEIEDGDELMRMVAERRQTVSVGSANNVAPVISVDDDVSRKKRLNFVCIEMQLILMQSVKEKNAHIETFGQKSLQYSKILVTFLAHIPQDVRDTHLTPSTKTLQDKSRALIIARRSYVQMSEAASGVLDEPTALEDMLDNIIAEQDEVDAERCRRKDESSRFEKRLEAAGDYLRKRSVQRMGTVQGIENGEEESSDIAKLKFDKISLLLQQQEVTSNRSSLEAEKERWKAEMVINQEHWKEEHEYRRRRREEEGSNSKAMLLMAEKMRAVLLTRQSNVQRKDRDKDNTVADRINGTITEDRFNDNDSVEVFNDQQ